MSRRSRYNDYYSPWPRYVPVAERRAKAARAMEKLRKTGENCQPVTIEGRTIARTFWGKGWCDHLETFGDYSNRLPRGRTYVRNGSVCHLGIERGRVQAQVAGSSLYRVNVTVAPLSRKKWDAIKGRCVGRIGSLIELLQGKLSDEIMSAVTDRQTGLFPLPGEIKYTCDCPDWANMCKHVSAVMYGIGARLDEQPELLFLLRGVDHEELVAVDAAAEALAGGGSRRTRRRALSESDMAAVFGVELEEAASVDPAKSAETDCAGAPTAPSRPPGRKGAGRRGKAKKPKNAAKRSTKKKPAKATPGRAKHKRAEFLPNGRAVTLLRQDLGLSKAEFARAVGVSPVTVANWENTRGAIRPHAKGLAGLRRLYAHET